MELFWAILLKPFVAVLFLSVGWFVRLAVIKWMKDGRLKRLLLSPAFGRKQTSYW